MAREIPSALAASAGDSSKPPSSDRLGRKSRSLRKKSGKKSGKKPGGQLGHRGETRHLVATPDVILEQRPAVCLRCQTPLPAATPAVARERRQVVDVPPLRLQVTEHQALPVRCPECQHITVGVFPAESTSRAQYGPRLRALAVYLVQQQLVPYARVRALLVGGVIVFLAGILIGSA